MLNLKKDFNFDDFESLLKDARRESSSSLLLPSGFKHVGFWGQEVALIQLLVTWARAHPAPEIKTHINDVDTDSSRSSQLDDLGKRLFGISALYLTSKVVTGQGTPILKEEYAAHCAKVLKQMYSCDIYSPESVNETYPKNRDKVAAQFMCLHGTKYEFQRSLYNGPSRKEAIGRKEFKALVRSALCNNNLPGNKRFAASIGEKPALVNGLANLIYELFQNTNDHAYEQLDGSSFEKNIRAISLKSHTDNVENKNLFAMWPSNEPFNSYLDHCKKLFTRVHHFLELSVVDGGLGMAQRFTGKLLEEISIEEEREITVKCFQPGVSSKGSQSRGEGLDEVWRALCELDGFIRIRTGRVCLFQTFHDKKPSDDKVFSSSSESPLEHAAGTAFTVIIPCVF